MEKVLGLVSYADNDEKIRKNLPVLLDIKYI